MRTVKHLLTVACLLLGGCLTACSGQKAQWSVIDANYTGRPGLLIEWGIGDGHLYIGMPGEANAAGEASGATEEPPPDPGQ